MRWKSVRILLSNCQQRVCLFLLPTFNTDKTFLTDVWSGWLVLANAGNHYLMHCYQWKTTIVYCSLIMLWSRSVLIIWLLFWQFLSSPQNNSLFKRFLAKKWFCTFLPSVVTLLSFRTLLIFFALPKIW